MIKLIFVCLVFGAFADCPRFGCGEIPNKNNTGTNYICGLNNNNITFSVTPCPQGLNCPTQNALNPDVLLTNMTDTCVEPNAPLVGYKAPGDICTKSTECYG